MSIDTLNSAAAVAEAPTTEAPAATSAVTTETISSYGSSQRTTSYTLEVGGKVLRFDGVPYSLGADGEQLFSQSVMAEIQNTLMNRAIVPNRVERVSVYEFGNPVQREAKSRKPKAEKAAAKKAAK